MTKAGPIGVFDSGYGGLTVLKEMRQLLPDYNYLYLGDSARTPYGNRSYQTVYQYTLQAVRFLFAQGCHLVILACNTASAKALRTIQQNDLPGIDPARRVLGVIRPSVEEVGKITKTGHIGVLGTRGTVNSLSFPMEIEKIYPEVEVWQHACPLWVPIVENNETGSEGAAFFIKKDLEALLSQSKQIDTIILGCTHYPLLLPVISRYIPAGVQLVPQNKIVALSLQDYLKRHPEMEVKCSRGTECRYFTTDDPDTFAEFGEVFMNEKIFPQHAVIG